MATMNYFSESCPVIPKENSITVWVHIYIVNGAKHSDLRSSFRQDIQKYTLLMEWR